MVREIKGLSIDKFKEIQELIPRSISYGSFNVDPDDKEDIDIDVKLNENTILKVRNDSLSIDLGGTIVTLEDCDFVSINIW